MIRFLLLILFLFLSTKASAEVNFKFNNDQIIAELNSFFHLDFNSFNNSSSTIDNNTDSYSDGFRRARLASVINFYDKIKFKADYDFIQSNLTPRDLFLEFTNILGENNLRVGHFKEPFGFEELSSVSNVNFIERSLTRVFHPIRNNGAMIYGNLIDQNSTYAIGLFQNTDKHLNKENSNYSITGRLTNLLNESNTNRTHLGLSYRHLNIKNRNSISFKHQPETFYSDNFLNTREIILNKSDSLGVELFTDYKSLYLQSEYLANWSKNASYDTNYYSSFYTQIGYFITSEKREYLHNTGTLGDLEYINNSDYGAVELVARYSTLDLDDKDKNGVMDNMTLGLNYYISKQLRLMFDYTYSKNNISGKTNILLGRLQLEL